MIEFASPITPQRHLLQPLVPRQRQRRSGDEALSAYPGQDCGDEHDHNLHRERLQSRLNPAKSSSTSDPAVRRSGPAPLKSP